MYNAAASLLANCFNLCMPTGPLIAAVVQGVLSVSEGCALGSLLEEEDASHLNEIGHFLDKDNPANCSGQLVAWHLCYHTNAAPRRNLTVTLRLWRPSDNGQR